METLKSALNERHHERNELRRELQKAHADLEELRQQAPPASASNQSEADDAEQDLLLPEQTVGQQPVRLIEFPRDFAGTLRRVPAHVSRATLIALGRIASGEPDAFIGSIHLKACEGVLRRRIGEYRLLYRLHAESVQVIDLIPRCELRRRVKEFIGS
jgi:mRNA-degrading endonuclease RelE of RelBE toxin-antitoxin system